MLENIFLDILSVSLTTSAVIALIFVASALIRKRYSAKWRYLAWILLTARLVIPFTVQLSDQPVEITVPQREITWNASANLTSEPLIVDQPSESEAAPVANTVQTNDRAAAEPAAAPGVQPTPSLRPAENTDRWRSISLTQLSALFWLIGMGIFAGWRLFHYAYFNHQIRLWSHPVEEARILSHLRVIRWEMNLMRPIPLLLCAKVTTPMMTGLFHPKLLLPTLDYSEEELTAIFRHELTHFKRHDIWLKLLLTTANMLHWFNPLVWWMARAAERDIEFSCDAAVVHGKDLEERASYSEAILAAISRENLRQKRMGSRLATTFSIVPPSDRKELRRRFANIFDMRRHRKGTLALVSVVLIASLSSGLVACNFNGPKQTNQELTIFCSDQTVIDGMESILGRYRRNHPGIEVKITEIPQFTKSPRTDNAQEYQEYERARVEYQQKISEIYQDMRNDLITGKGPDLVIVSHDYNSGVTIFPDIYKIMSAGVFTDLTPYLEADKELDLSEYNQKVIEGGKLRGKQYLMPLNFSFKPLVASMDFLTEQGLDVPNLSTITGLYEELADYYGKAGEEGAKPFAAIGQAKEFPLYLGASVLDYEEKTVQLDSPAFRALQEDYRTIYAMDQKEVRDPKSKQYPRMESGEAFFYQNYRMGYSWGPLSTMLLESGIVPYYQPIRDENGQIPVEITLAAGINTASQNKQNAYDFLHELLSSTFQDYYTGQVPVWRSDYYMSNRISSYQEMLGRNDQVNTGLSEGSGVGPTSKSLAIADRISDSTFTDMEQWLSELGEPYFLTDLPERLYDYFEPYYKGEKTYEECWGKAQSGLEIYITE